jgi:hypothetical protein
MAVLVVGVLLSGVITALSWSASEVPCSLYNLEIAIQSRRGVMARNRIAAL